MDKQMTKEELLDYLIDKFNLTLEIEKSKIEGFITQLSHKVVTWELVTHIIGLVIMTIVFIAVTIFLIKYNKKHKCFKLIKDTWNSDTIDKETSMLVTKSYVLCIFYFVFAFVNLITFIDYTSTVIQCIFIPEKIFIEFIGKYI